MGADPEEAADLGRLVRRYRLRRAVRNAVIVAT